MGAGMAWQWDLGASLGWAASGDPGGSGAGSTRRSWQVRVLAGCLILRLLGHLAMAQQASSQLSAKVNFVLVMPAL